MQSSRKEACQKNYRIRASEGLAVVRVEYKFGSDIEAKYQEIIREVSPTREGKNRVTVEGLWIIIIDNGPKTVHR